MIYGVSYELENELRTNREELEILYIEVEKYRLMTAMYYSFCMKEWDLGERLENQLKENRDAIIGDFDGFAYSSVRANAEYRTLEHMLDDGIITKSEYNFCNI